MSDDVTLSLVTEDQIAQELERRFSSHVLVAVADRVDGSGDRRLRVRSGGNNWSHCEMIGAQRKCYSSAM